VEGGVATEVSEVLIASKCRGPNKPMLVTESARRRHEDLAFESMGPKRSQAS